MVNTPIITWLTIGLTALFSIRGFNDSHFFQRFMLQVGPVLRDRDYKRVLTAAFLHVDWAHLLFNMLALYFFAGTVLRHLGNLGFLAIYLGSIVASGSFSVFYHQRDYAYSAVGASGGVSGILFASILLYPDLRLYIFPIPIPVPGYLFGIGYLLYSVYGMRHKFDRVGHTAHFAGALAGIVISLLLAPVLLKMRGQILFLLLIPIALLFYILYRKK